MDKIVFFYHKDYLQIRQVWKRKAAADAAAKDALLLAEGLAVGALVNGGIGLVGAYKNTIQRTVVFGVAVIGALLNGAFNALVGVAVHDNSSFF